MSNPLSPKPNDDSQSKDKTPEKQAEPAGLSFDDVMPRGQSDPGAKAAADAFKRDMESAANATPDISGMARPLFTFSHGQAPLFLTKSEFLIEKPMTQVRPLIDKFLKDTPIKEDRNLTAAEMNELAQSRQALTNTSNATETLNKALHLSRLYQHLRYIEEAKKATDLSLGIDPENHTAIELFKELERMHPPDMSVANRPAAVQVLSKSNLRNRIANLSQGRVIVVGDLLLDELLEGKPERISREAPVLILEHVDTELIPGGAANTVNNISALGGQCHAIGICGQDEYATKLAHLFDAAGISHNLVCDPSRPTTVKTRILSKSHSFKQQLLRLDRISHEPVDKVIEDALKEKIQQAAPNYQAIVLSDYRAGVITDGIINTVRQIARQHNLMVIVDAQANFSRFKNATLLTPNQPDTEAVVGFAITDKNSLLAAGQQVLESTAASAVLITRGAQGMVLFEANQSMVELPAFNRSEVFDVTGAGDTVIATMALALVSGANFVEAMALGNLAAGIVVKKQGTSVTSQKEMLAALETVNLPEQ